jgi:hypothetical protein
MVRIPAVRPGDNLKAIRGRMDARWLPSRHHFALFRLYAYWRLGTAKPELADVTLMVIEYQSAFETYSVTVWLLLSTSCVIAAEVSRVVFWPVAIPLSILLASVALEIPFFLAGGLATLLHRLSSKMAEQHQRLTSAATMAFLIAAACWYWQDERWVRYVAWQFLALVALNAVASVIAFAMRGAIDRLEATYGGETFAA